MVTQCNTVFECVLTHPLLHDMDQTYHWFVLVEVWTKVANRRCALTVLLTLYRITAPQTDMTVQE